MEEVFAQTMPREMGFGYLGMSFQEKKAQEGVSPMVIFGFSLLCVFLILAAQYESWSLPFSVLLGTPIAVFGAFAALMVGRFENNVYAQIGLVMLIGLAAKNAILIVEFSKMGVEQGKPLMEAALEGARLRLRPILMTSFAFILGCVPLATASGAGGLSRQVMGFAVIGGMLAASVIAIFLIPVTFYVVEKFSGRKHVRSGSQRKKGRQAMSKIFISCLLAIGSPRLRNRPRLPEARDRHAAAHGGTRKKRRGTWRTRHGGSSSTTRC